MSNEDGRQRIIFMLSYLGIDEAVFLIFIFVLYHFLVIFQPTKSKTSGSEPSDSGLQTEDADGDSEQNRNDG